MPRRRDWGVITRELNAYLDGLDPLQRPMSFAAFADVLGISWKTLGRKAMQWPQSEWGRAVARCKSADARWRSMFLKAAKRRLGTIGHVPELAREFGLTSRQVDGLIRDARRDGKLPASKRRRHHETKA